MRARWSGISGAAFLAILLLVRLPLSLLLVGARVCDAAFQAATMAELRAETSSAALSQAGMDAGDESRDLDEATIRLIQQQLRAAGFDPGTDSGVLDTETRAALRAYQAASGLPATGKLDGVTHRLLLSITDSIRG
jgi:peptidoglycan hydrolase-like protein with peptidoglycan-binding domain